MIHPDTLKFLKSLKKNNNKVWFDAHKEDYLTAKENVENFVQELIKDLSMFDKALSGLKAKDCVFRIYRDVRFSKDKIPYKVNMGASINAGGKKAIGPGYYLHIEPGRSFLAGGMWMPPSDQIKKVRQEIDYNGKKIIKILGDPSFKKYFGKLDSTYQLKTTPKGYPKDHPNIDLLRYNSFIVWHQYDDKETLSPKFVKEVAKGSKVMKPLLDFLSTAIS